MLLTRLFSAAALAILSLCAAAQCTQVQLNFNSNMADQGPSFVQWYASVYQGNTFNQGVCQFSPNDAECSATLCLENGCYTFLITAPNNIQPWEVGFGVNVTVGGESVTQQLQSYNPGGNQYTFTIGVNSDCVECGIAVSEIPQVGNILVLQATEFAPGAQIYWTQNGNQVNIGTITTFILQPGANQICASYETPECPQGVFWCETFNYEPNGGCLEGLLPTQIDCNTFTFALLGVNDNNANVAWNFGNGVMQTGTGTSITYTYPENGNYNVIAMYQGEDCPGGQGIENFVTVACETGGDCPTEMGFEQTSCGNFTFFIPGASPQSQVFWNLNNNTVSNTGQPVSFEFGPGTYQGYAIYQAPNCPVTTFVVNWTVEACNPVCPTEILVSEVNECGLYAFNLMGFPQFGDISWSWGDGGSNVGANGVSHTYPTPGTYEVCVTASTDACPQGTTICIPLVVDGCELPCPGGIEVVELGCGLYGFEVGSVATVTAAVWNFDDGSTETGGHYITHQFTEPGVYVVQVNAGLTIPCFNNFFTVTIVVENCFGGCPGGLNFNQMACGYYYFSAPESNSAQYVQWSYTIGDQEYNITTEGNGFISQVFPQGVYEVCGTYFSPDCSEGMTFCQVIEVPNCNGNECNLDVVANTNNGTVYWFQAAPGSLTPQYWILPNGEIHQGPGWEHAFTEPGTYTICAHYFSPVCGELEDCVTITIGGGDCTEVGFILESNYMMGGPLNAVWSLTGPATNLEGFASLTPNTPIYDWNECLPDGCYTLTVIGQNMQNPAAFGIDLTGGWEVVSESMVQDGGQFFYTFDLALNSDCGQEPDCYEGGFFADSFMNQGGPHEATWVITQNGITQAQGAAGYTLEDPYFDFTGCLPTGCYVLHVTGYGSQNLAAFSVGMSGAWEAQNVETAIVGNQIHYYIEFSVNGGCGEGDCSMEIQATTENGFFYVFSATENSGVQPMGWILPGGVFIEGPVVENVFTVPGTYEVCAVYEAPGCVLTECLEVVIEDSEECYLTTITVSAEFSDFELQVLAWYLESEGFELDGELVLTEASNTFSVTACLPADCYSLTFETPGGVLNALAASIMITVNGAEVSLSDWPEDAGSYTIEFGVMADCGDNVNELTSVQPALAYPNPNNGTFTLVTDAKMFGANAKILDTAGREIHAFRINGEVSFLELPEVAQGLYFLQLAKGDMIETLRLSVLK